MNHDISDDLPDELTVLGSVGEEPEAPEADVAEQRRSAIPQEEPEPLEMDPEAPEADVAEQRRAVPYDEEDY
jgi:hypothetical protein